MIFTQRHFSSLLIPTKIVKTLTATAQKTRYTMDPTSYYATFSRRSMRAADAGNRRAHRGDSINKPYDHTDQPFNRHFRRPDNNYPPRGYRYGLEDEYTFSHPSSSQIPPVPIDAAIMQLKPVLKKTIALFAKLVERFEDAISYIKPFTDPKVLDMIWASMVRDPSMGRRPDERWHRNNDGNRGQQQIHDGQCRTEVFVLSRELVRALQLAATATVRPSTKRSGGLGTSRTPNSDRELRMIKKMGRAAQDCKDLLKKAFQEYSQVAVLQKELDLVRMIVQERSGEEDIEGGCRLGDEAGNDHFQGHHEECSEYHPQDNGW